jgi:phosphoribosyl 1,2-cyclic phosphodiesterase
VLASSSAGNSIFIASPATRILIDAGLNRKQILARLEAIGEDPWRLDGILVTHEHSDHITGLPVLTRTKGMKARVFATRGTAEAIDWGGPEPEVAVFQAGAEFEIGDLRIQSFTIPHDAADPVGFTVTVGKTKLSIVTDLGYLPNSVKWHLRDSQFILLESNHCPEMLRVGPYPWQVKQRILSRKGHLSNDAASDYIADDEGLPEQTETLILGHLSETNNSPWHVRLVAEQALQMCGKKPRLVVAEPRQQSELFQL